jgi:hypothetical protein
MNKTTAKMLDFVHANPGCRRKDLSAQSKHYRSRFSFEELLHLVIVQGNRLYPMSRQATHHVADE